VLGILLPPHNHPWVGSRKFGLSPTEFMIFGEMFGGDERTLEETDWFL
jgi:hypothetical protein